MSDCNELKDCVRQEIVNVLSELSYGSPNDANNFLGGALPTAIGAMIAGTEPTPLGEILLMSVLAGSSSWGVGRLTNSGGTLESLIGNEANLNDIYSNAIGGQAVTGIRADGEIIIFIDSNTPWIAVQHDVIHAYQDRRVLDAGVDISVLSDELRDLVVDFKELETYRWESQLGNINFNNELNQIVDYEEFEMLMEDFSLDPNFISSTEHNLNILQNSVTADDFIIGYHTNETFRMAIDAIATTYVNDPILAPIIDSIRNP